mmetsp:Transcript_6247/g.11124  ORF Transcript_6247/g.11124 Transcript_6247/m.11124 type:complete len:434 (-) Transcript_6247:43-1344(-)
MYTSKTAQASFVSSTIGSLHSSKALNSCVILNTVFASSKIHLNSWSSQIVSSKRSTMTSTFTSIPMFEKKYAPASYSRITSQLSTSSVSSSEFGSGTPITDGITLEFIKQGPLLVNNEFKCTMDLSKWKELGRELELAIAVEEGVEAVSPERIFHYYIPVYFWLDSVREARLQKNNSGGALLVGLSCPQGGGKTTLTQYVSALFASRGLRCAVASIDDFYNTYEELQEVALKNKGNSLLEYRGNAGTHDIPLMLETIRNLCKSEPQTVHVPRYNKSAYGGRGDRAAFEKWEAVNTPVDIILLEGWCLGFRSRSDVEFVKNVSAELLPVNENLKAFEELYKEFDAGMIVKIGDANWVFEWRAQAEKRLREATGGKGMTEEQVKDFVQRFMPAYKAYLPELYSKSAEIAPCGLTLEIDQQRVPRVASFWPTPAKI